ncbi:MAG: mevalonate kinase family protein [Bdellovibrionales bacterium]
MSSSHNNDDRFSSKILLFGEYTLITGSKALAFPLHKFSGTFTKVDGHMPIQSHVQLNDFCKYLQGSKMLSDAMDLTRFEKDIEQGCYFDANIPHGYGIGSSGALCAAVYARYAHDFKRKEVYDNHELNLLKDMMALMEGFYHGTSSGLDCLISLVDRPVLIQGRNNFDLIKEPELDKLGKFYLYDSGKSRKTGPLVQNVLQKYEQDPKYKQELNKLSTLVDTLIEDTLNHNKNGFKEHLYELSHAQYLHFSDMIPDEIKALWLVGLETKQYLFKLCGAGGGGFFLVYSDDEVYHKDCDYTLINEAV